MTLTHVIARPPSHMLSLKQSTRVWGVRVDLVVPALVKSVSHRQCGSLICL